MTILNRPPMIFRIARRLPRAHLIKPVMIKWPMMRQAAYFKFYDSRVAIPLDEYDAWHYLDMDTYQFDRSTAFAQMCDNHMSDYDLVDCGAHLGLFTAQFAHASHNCRRITAVEPNERIAALAEINLRTSQVKDVAVVHAAIAGFEGRGRMVSPEYDPSTQAIYLAPDPAGDIDVIQLGSLANRIGPEMALKMDVEGTELDVLESASELLRSRQKMVICIEMHRTVFKRVGVTDIETLRRIDAIRRFTWSDADTPGVTLDPTRSIFEQVRKPDQCDLIGVADP